MATLRKDGRWMSRRTVGGIQITGYGKTPQEADEDLESKLTPSTVRPTLHDFAKQSWYPTLKYKASNTRKRYEDIYVLHLRESIARRPIDEIAFADCQELVNSLPVGSARLIHTVLSQIFNLAVNIGVLQRNPARGVRTPPKTEKRERVLTVAQASAVLDRCPYPLNRGVFLTMILGMRLGEVCGLRWDDLDRQKGTLRIHQQAQQKNSKGGGIEMVPLKTRGSKRTLILTKELIQEIDRRGDIDSEWIAARNGKQYPPETMSEHWRNWVRADSQKDLDLKDWRFHDLRHSAAGLLYASGVDIAAIAAVLGHKNLDMTWIYLTLQEEQRRDAFRSLTNTLKLGAQASS